MDTYNGYETEAGVGVKCSKCGEWIKPGQKAVCAEPVIISKEGSTFFTTKDVHGVLHVGCWKEI